MPKVKVDGIEVEVAAGSTVLQACEAAGKEIPRFCYHERLSIAGNCRMCLVEMEKSPKPVASCAMPVMDGQVIYTNTPMVKKAREGVMEFLLINHPLDCPICDQGGECDLQDQSYKYGGGRSRYELNKRSVNEKNMGPLIKTHMNRCIHCTRCVRFSEEVAGVSEIGAINRGENMEITTFLQKATQSEMSANVIDLCPVGALTSRPYSYEARPWELNKTETIDVMDAVGSNIRMDSKGWEVKRILPRLNDEINEEWISDKTRYACDGLLNNRLDQPYIRENGKLREASWKETYKFLKENLANKKSFGGLVGQLTDIETSYAFKKLFENAFSSNLLDFRQKDIAYDLSSRFNYQFNTTIAGIDNCDVILLIGANPRLEATIVNTRILKAVKRGAKVLAIGDPGDQNYKVHNLGNNLSLLNDLINNNISEAKLLKEASNPAIIIGESVLKKDSYQYVLNASKKLLKDINKLNGFNILHQSASTVGSLLLGLVTDKYEDLINSDVLYLLGADEIKINKKDNQFVIYQGSHGNGNAEIADVILPGAAYSEKDGSFANMEGRVQRTFKGSFPPGEAKEDFVIINEISKILEKDLGLDSLKKIRAELEKDHPAILNYDLLTEINLADLDISYPGSIDHKFQLDEIDYYQTNIIAKSSLTMNECKASKQSFEKTGTDQ